MSRINRVDSLAGLTAFTHAVQTGSFVTAADQLGLSASAVSKSISRLESALGVTLFNRSTRSLSLTVEGELFYARSRRILDELEQAEQELSRQMESPRGKLRASFPAIGYRMILPLLPDFRQRYPDIELDLDFNDRLVDMVGEGIDIVVRSGEFADSRLRARRLGSYRYRLVASPKYLRDVGTPEQVSSLRQHHCLFYRFTNTHQLKPWALSEPLPSEIMLTRKMAFNNMEALISAALRGMGIIYVPDFAVRQKIAEGSLQPVLDAFMTESGQFSLLWPDNRHVLPKLRVFIDYVVAKIDLGRE